LAQVVHDCKSNQIPMTNFLFALTYMVSTCGLRIEYLSSQSCVRPAENELRQNGLKFPELGSWTDSNLTEFMKSNADPNEGLLDFSGPPVDVMPECEIPKRMHFIWMGSQLTTSYVQNLVEFGRLNLKWEIYLWVDQPPHSNVSLMYKEISATLKIKLIKDAAHLFKNRDLMCQDVNYAGKSDLLRLEVVYLYGGIYIDLDTIPFHGFDAYGDLFRWPFTTYSTVGPSCNCLFGFASKSRFLEFAVDAVRENCMKYNNCGVMTQAGTGVFQAALLRYNSSDISLIPYRFMIADPNDSEVPDNRISAATFGGGEPGGWYEYHGAKKKMSQKDVVFCTSTDLHLDDTPGMLDGTSPPR